MTNVTATNLRTATLRWTGDLAFEGGGPDGPTAVVDANGRTAPGPMLQLLMAAAACSGADVADILRKMRVELGRLEIEVTGERREEHPRRYLSLHYVFRMAGEGLDDAKARRAIELSLTKYCSVIHSLNPDIPVTYDLELG